MLTHGKTQTCSGHCLLWDVNVRAIQKEGGFQGNIHTSVVSIPAAWHSLLKTLKPETPIFPCSPPLVSHPTKPQAGSEPVGKCWSSASELLIPKF